MAPPEKYDAIVIGADQACGSVSSARGRDRLSEREARKQRRRFRIAALPMNQVARALELGESRGVMKVLVDSETGCLIGAPVLGIEGGG